MPRSRNIKPALFKNELLGEADPLLTILFAGLWCLADRDGKLEDRPKRIKAEIFPYRELPDFNGYLTELARLGFIDRFVTSDTAVIEVINFAEHQSPHKTEKGSTLPDNPNKSDSCLSTVNAPLNDEKVTDVAALIPDSRFLIPDTVDKSVSVKSKSKKFIKPDKQELLAYVTERDKSGRPKDVAKAIWNHYESNGWKVGKNPMKSWQAAASGWIGRDM